MFKKFVQAMVLSLSLSACVAEGKDWTTTEKVMWGTYLTLSAYDAAQSWDIWDDPRYSEQNPLFRSREEMVAFKLLGHGLQYLLIERLTPKQSYVFIGTMIVIQGLVVKHNDSLGLSVNISF